MIKIGLLLIDGFALMSYSSVVEPLRAANLLSQKKLYSISNLSSRNISNSSSGAKVDTTIIGNENEKLDIIGENNYPKISITNSKFNENLSKKECK